MGRKCISVCLVALLLLIVFSFSVSADNSRSGSLVDLDHLELSSPAVYLMDAVTGTELYSRGAHERKAPASMTKIITLAVVFDSLAANKISLDDDVVTSSRASSMGGSQIFLEQGETMSVREMIKAVAISSANDASVALAEHVSGSVEAFAEEMNNLADRLQLENSNFVNPHGLDDPDHYSTAHDISHFSRYLLNEYPQVTEYTSIWSAWLREDTDDPFWLTNTNKLLQSFDGMDGLKTGKTDESGWCLSGTAKRDNMRLIATVMDAPTSPERFEDVAAILTAGFAEVETVCVAQPGDILATCEAWEAVTDQVELTVAQEVSVTVPRGSAEELAINITPPAEELIAPISSEAPVANGIVELDGRELTEFSLVPTSDVERASVFSLFVRTLRRLWLVK